MIQSVFKGNIIFLPVSELSAGSAGSAGHQANPGRPRSFPGLSPSSFPSSWQNGRNGTGTLPPYRCIEKHHLHLCMIFLSISIYYNASIMWLGNSIRSSFWLPMAWPKWRLEDEFSTQKLQKQKKNLQCSGSKMQHSKLIWTYLD